MLIHGPRPCFDSQSVVVKANRCIILVTQVNNYTDSPCLLLLLRIRSAHLEIPGFPMADAY